MVLAENPHVLRLPSARALEERKARQAMSPADYERLAGLIPEMGLEGAAFDSVSRVYPLEVPASPRATVLAENPRRVSIGLLNDHGQYVGVIGDTVFEEACVACPGALLYCVGKITERTKGDRVYLNLRPRGWVRVEVVLRDPERLSPKTRSRKR